MLVRDFVKVHTLQEINTFEGRHYITPKGDEYPSVTTVLGKRPKPELDEWRERLGDETADRYTRQSVIAGNVLHGACEAWLKGEEIPPMQQGNKWIWNAMRRGLSKISVVRGIELPLWSDWLKLAGRTDCIGIYDGVLSVIDFKNSQKHKIEEWIEDYFLQATIYAVMFMSVYRIPVKQVVILIATWDGNLQVFKQPVAKRLGQLENLMRKYNELW